MALTTPEVLALLNKCITTTQPDAVTLANNNDVVAGQFYYLSDQRIIIHGVSTNKFSINGDYIAINPDYQNTSGDYDSIWIDGTISPTVSIGKLYAYDGYMYESITGNNTPISPISDPTNWQFVPLTDPRYVTEVDAVIYDVFINAVLERRDKRYNAICTNGSISFFRWGDDTVNNNTIEGSLSINLKNYNGVFTNNYIGQQAGLYWGAGASAPYGISINNNSIIGTLVYLEGAAPIIYIFTNSNINLASTLSPVYLNIEYVRPNGQSLQYQLDGLNITINSSNYEAGMPPSAISGGLLTIPHYAAFAGILYVPAGTIDSIINEAYPYAFANNYLEVELRAELDSSFTITPTAKSTTSSYKIMSDNLAPVTISSPNPFMIPPYIAQAFDFYRVRNAFNFAGLAPSWHTITYKQYV